MITRFNYVLPKLRDSSHDDERFIWKLVKTIRVLSTNKDGSVDKYVEDDVWVKEKDSWSEFIKSYDLGSVSEQVINHITKGTPLVTAHTLPAGDYTKLEKGAEIKREMAQKGITLEMLVQALNEAGKPEKEVVSEKKEGAE